jgi:hypothetical protein
MPAARFLPRVTARAGALALSAALLAVAPHVAGPPATPAADRAEPLRLKAVPTTQVGRVEGTRAYIAVSFDGHRVRVYVCDGTLKRPATIAQWFSARWEGRAPHRMVRNGIAVRLDPVASDGRISGELIAFSGPHSFTVAPPSGAAGLYDGRAGRARDTWIVQPDGSLRGAMVCQRRPVRKCRVVVVTTADGQTREEVRCFQVSGCGF